MRTTFLTHRKPNFKTIFDALNQRAFFKLICGGSFSDTERLGQLINIYTQAGAHAIDVSAAWPVVTAAVEMLQQYPHPPLLMVSFPLDADPHFRKIKLAEPACIRCGLCLPVCPTDVFTLPPNGALGIHEPACYGCGRCLPICPTGALDLDNFSVHPDLTRVLSHPAVNAVEIHTTYVDSVMVDTLYAELGSLLQDKLISVCLRPQTLPLDQSLAFISRIKRLTPFPLIVQVDGSPMSGSDDPDSSVPALEVARGLAPYLPQGCYLTISGGINAQTATYLQQPMYRCIQGVGMGTYARQRIWDFMLQPEKAVPIANALVGRFRSTEKSGIMLV